MKKFAVILIAVGLFGAMPVMAAEPDGMTMGAMEGMTMNTSEGMRECAMQAESIQQKIARIQKQIDEGSKKYSAKDLKNLKAKLKEANDTLDSLSNEAGYQR